MNVKSKDVFLISIVICLFFCFLGALFIFCGEPSYLNSLMYLKKEQEWIITVWIGILAIHGTLAALSITFMSAFITTASDINIKNFQRITREIILKKHKFLFFSLFSGYSLLIGVFYIYIGGGVLHYCLSSSLSILFIFYYIRIYYLLYNISENEKEIFYILINAIKLEAKQFDENHEKMQKVNEDFSSFISNQKNIKIIESNDRLDSLMFSNLHFKGNESLFNFNKRNISKLDKYISNQLKQKDIDIKINIIKAKFDFYESYSIDIHIENIDLLTNDELTNLEKKIEKTFIIRKNTSNYLSIKKNLIDSIYTNLIDGNQNQLSECIKIYKAFLSPKGLLNFITDLEKRIHGGYKKPEYQLLSYLYKELFYSCFDIDKDEGAQKIYKSMLELPLYIYSDSTYKSFYLNETHFLEDKAIFNEEIYLDIYLKSTYKNIIYLKYDIINLNIKLISEKIKYVGENHESLTVKQKILLTGVIEIVALLSVRFKFLKNRHKNENIKNELKTIYSCLAKLMSSDFFNELYYLQETYEILFNYEKYFTEYDAVYRLIEMPENSIYSNDVLDYYQISTLYIILNKDSKLNTTFIYDYTNFFNKTLLTTGKIENLMKILNSYEFKELITTNYNNPTLNIKEKINKMQEEIIQLNSALKNKITQDIKNKKIDNTIFNKYKNDINKRVEYLFKNNFNLKKHSSKIVENPFHYSFSVDKRMLIPAVDGCYYVTNHENISHQIIYYFLTKMIRETKFTDMQLIKIVNINELPNNEIITIKFGNYMPSLESYLSKIRINDRKKYLPFQNDGLYYISIKNNFEFIYNQNLIELSVIDSSKNDIDKAIDQDLNVKINAKVNIEFQQIKIPIKVYYLEK